MTAGGLSAAGLGRLHDIMAGYVRRGDAPGIVALVSRHGEAHVEAIGTMELGGITPIRRDAIFRIASMTKPITAAATMVLVEDGNVRLDEPVDRWLPELAHRQVLRHLAGPLDDTVPARRPITVRDLLTFTMGFGIFMAPLGTYPIQRAIHTLRLGQGPPTPSVPPAPDEWIRRLGTLPLMHQPGETWMYNTGSDVLGVLIARASGQPFETFLRERLFERLGMKDTAFSVSAAKIDRLSTSYLPRPGGALEIYDRAAGGQWSRPPAFPSGAAGLVSTVDDYLAFGQMLLRKGEHGNDRILSTRSVETMTTDQLTQEQKTGSGLLPGYFDGHGWGFGMAVLTAPDELADEPGRFGWDGGLGTSWYCDPKEDLIGILMTQRGWTSPSPPDVCRDFWSSTYGAIQD